MQLETGEIKDFHIKRTNWMNRRIKKTIQRDLRFSGLKIIAEIPEVIINNVISARTVQRRLAKAKLYRRRTTKKPLVSESNRRLEFARPHLTWAA